MSYHRLPTPLPRITDPAVKRRFVRKLLVVGPGSVKGCWLWKGYVCKQGYGRFSYNGRTHLAHRIAYAIYRGSIPINMTVGHTLILEGLDAPLKHDVNPANLELCTWAENVAEGNSRGGPRGIVRTQAEDIDEEPTPF